MEKHISKKVRLNRYLAQCGLGSRRECDVFIASGKILINGEKVATLGTCINPDIDKVAYKGKVVREIKKLEYIAYHKPRGAIVTKNDPQQRKTIYDALSQKGFDASHLKYIGRLDRNSEGLLLLTNDGTMIHALTHPRFHIKKVYKVKISHRLSDQDITKLLHQGIVSNGQVLKAGDIRESEAENQDNRFWYTIVLFEGKNRQIRRMIEALGYEIQQLIRIQFGTIKLGTLKRGDFRFLKEREISGLKRKGYETSV